MEIAKVAVRSHLSGYPLLVKLIILNFCNFGFTTLRLPYLDFRDNKIAIKPYAFWQFENRRWHVLFNRTTCSVYRNTTFFCSGLWASSGCWYPDSMDATERATENYIASLESPYFS